MACAQADLVWSCMDFYNADDTPDQEDEDKFAAVRVMALVSTPVTGSTVGFPSGLRTFSRECGVPH